MTRDLTGQRFGRLTVVKLARPRGRDRRRAWLCRCDCGKMVRPLGDNIFSGHTQSCGCISKENCAKVGSESIGKHGFFEVPEYQAWRNMKMRAKDYGVVVDPLWVSDFMVFLGDVGERPSASHRLTLATPSLGFTTENCGWAPWVKNVDRKRSREVAWREANKEALRQKDRIYYLNNKPKYRAHAHARRALVLSAGGFHTAADVDKILRLQRGRCAYCPAKLTPKNMHVDHIVALSRGGHNGRRNIQATCQRCNLSKGAKDPIEYAQSTGRLI